MGLGRGRACYFDASPAVSLHDVHFPVGDVDQRTRGDAAFRVDRGADAHTHAAIDAAADGEWPLEAFEDLARGVVRIVAVSQFVENDDELIPAHARNRVARAYVMGETFANRLQNLIAGAVTVGVVDALEVVDVEKEYRAAGTTALCA